MPWTTIVLVTVTGAGGVGGVGAGGVGAGGVGAGGVGAGGVGAGGVGAGACIAARSFDTFGVPKPVQQS